MNHRKYFIAFISSLVSISILLNISVSLYEDEIYTEDEKWIQIKRKWIKTPLQGPPPSILVFGDSTIANGFSPKLFDEQFGNNVKSLNMGFAFHDVSKFSFILKDYLTANPNPEHILLYLSSPRKYHHLLGGNTFEEMLYFSHKRPVEGKRNSRLVLSYFLPGLNLTKIKRLAERTLSSGSSDLEVSKKSLRDNNGQYWWFDSSKSLKKPTEKRKSIECKFPLEDNLHGYGKEVAKFLALTENLKIKVTIFFAPLPKGYCVPPSRPYPGMVNLNNNYSNIVTPMPLFFFYPYDHFFDKSHLNKKGAKNFSRDLANSFRELLRR